MDTVNLSRISRDLFIEGGITHLGIFYVLIVSFLVYSILGGFILSRYLKSRSDISLELGMKIVLYYHSVSFFINYFFLSIFLLANSYKPAFDGLSLADFTNFYLQPSLLPFTAIHLIIGLFLSYVAGGLVQANFYKYFYYGFSQTGANPLLDSFLANHQKSNISTTVNGKEVSTEDAQKIAEEINKFTQSMFEKSNKS